MRTSALLPVLVLPLLPTSVASAQCEEAKLVAPTTGFDSQTGTALAVAGDLAVAGSPYDSEAASLAGAAYVYDRTPAGWVVAAKLMASDAADLDRMGTTVDVDGERVVVGARYDQEAGYATGAAYVFQRVDGVWVEEQKLLSELPDNNDFFGQSVGIDDESGVCVVGAHGESSGGGQAGAVFVFELLGGTWVQTATLFAEDAEAADQLGWSIAVSGNVIFAGARGRDDLGAESGAVYVFRKTGGVWSQTAKLVASNGAPTSRFGISVHVDGSRAVVGASLHDGAGTDTGAAYIFDRVAGAWNESARLSASVPHAGDRFGSSVSVDGKYVAIGAWGLDGVANNAGGAYVYEKVGAGAGDWAEIAVLQADDAQADDNFGWTVGIEGDSLVVGARNDDDVLLNGGATYVYQVPERIGLWGDTSTVSLSTGGTQNLQISTCPPQPGAFYFVLGSATGAEPGFDYGAFHFPLNPDFYFLVTVRAPDFYPLAESTGTLDANGEGTARFTLNVGEDPGLAGIVLHHAAAVLDPLSSQLVPFGATPVAVELVP